MAASPRWRLSMLAAASSLLVGCAAAPSSRLADDIPPRIAATDVVVVAFAPDFPEAKLGSHGVIGVALDGADAPGTGGRTTLDALALIHPAFDFLASMLNPCGGFTIALVDEEAATARIASLSRWP